jgi:hypothetical protein
MADRLADGGAAGGHSRPSGRRVARRFPHVATGCEARYCSVLVSIKGDTDGVLRLPRASRTSEGFSASTEYFARQSHCPVYAIPAPSKNINRATNPAETARDQFWGKNAPAVCLCHPLSDSFPAAIRKDALEGLAGAGHDVDLLDLYGEDFDCPDGRGPAALSRCNLQSART